MQNIVSLSAAAALAVAATPAFAQAPKGAPQLVRPPVAQAWVDVATFAGMGMPAAGGGAMGMLGGMLGGSKNEFLNTRVAQPGRWVDVTLHTSRNPGLAEALQAVPAGTQLAPTLKLVSPDKGKPPPPPDEDRDEPIEYERPKGKLLLYWGCGESVRPGQPRVLDFSKLSSTEAQKFFIARSATQRGAHSAVGRPHWPNRDDARMVPANASLVGEHGFSGQGVPEGFRFNVPAAQDLMPAVELAQRDSGGATVLDWKPLPTARAYFIAAAGGKSGGGSADVGEIVFWTSSEEPDTGSGLVDYQTNAAVDRWLKERVLLPSTATTCTVPKGIFGDGAMLRMIAYGTELNLVHPPRPADPKIAWEPQWAVKLRVKSVASAMLGMDMGAMMRGGSRGEAEAPPAAEPATAEPKQPSAVDEALDAVNKLRGLLGR
jgi:hypothetical protein